jgi:hypothetical protein
MVEIVARASGQRLPEIGAEVAIMVEGSALAYAGSSNG